MDFLAGIGEEPVGKVVSGLVAEGGGTAIGFIGAGFLGGQTEKMLLAKDAAGSPIPVVETSTTADKLKAWAGNNAPKIVAWYVLRGRPIGTALDDVKKAVAGSVMYDTLVRLSNKGVAPLYPTVFGLGDNDVPIASLSKQEVQRLIQENGVLRQQLVKATQRLSDIEKVRSDIESSQYPEIREREYGFMQPPAIEERERRFGFAGDEPSIAQAFGML